jgi:hypothetical protein
MDYKPTGGIGDSVLLVSDAAVIAICTILASGYIDQRWLSLRIVLRIAAFSWLEPKIISPLSSKIAVPTLNLEYGAYAVFWRRPLFH